MASLYSRNGNFYGQWFDTERTPRQKRHSLGTNNPRTALRLLERADEAAKLGKWDPWTDPLSILNERPATPLTVEVAVSAFLTSRGRTLRPQTLTSYRSVLTRFSEAVGIRTPLARITPAHVDAFTFEDGLKASTQRLRLRILRAFLRWHKREGNVANVAAERVSPPPLPARVPRAVSLDELHVICRTLRADYERRREATAQGEHPHDRVQDGDLVWMEPLFRFAFYTGMRLGELGRMKWGHVDCERGLICIEVQKNKRASTIPLTNKAAEVLGAVERREAEDYVFTAPQGAHLRERSDKSFGNVVSQAFTRYRKAAGIERPFTFHCLRHGFATALAEAGRSAWVIQAACRHSSVAVSQVYVSLANQTLKTELEGVFG